MQKTKEERRAILLDESRSPVRNIIWLAWPIFLENVLSTLVSYADTAMVGALGAYATASVSISNSVVFLFNGTILALGVGVTALISQSIGAQDYDLTKKLARHAVLILLYLGLPIALLLGLGSRLIPLWMGAGPDIIDYATKYNIIVAFGRPFAIASMLIFSAMRGCGDTKTPLRINIGVNIANVVGNFFLINPTRTVEILGMNIKIIGAGWGVAGAAAATAFSWFLGGGAALLILFRKKSLPMCISIKDSFRMDFKVMGRILKISIPAMVERVCMSLAGVVIARNIASLGTVAIAANSVYVTAEGIAFMPGFAFASASTTLVGQSIGAKKTDLASRYMRSCVITAVIVMAVAGAGLFFFGKYIVRVFTPDPDVIALATVCLQIAALLQPAQTGAMVFAGGLRGAGDTLWPMIITASCMWVFRAGIGAILCIGVFGLGLPAAVWCMVADSYVRFFLFFLRTKSGKWKTASLKKQEIAPAASEG
ncbi:MAG: MATE family efflux transporter [Oscillospiraceae bacterium]|nr:MATE family efflux transporter [Oscillospiraceae bacterium]